MKGFPRLRIASCLGLIRVWGILGAGLTGMLRTAHAGTGDGTPGDANIRYVGRWDRSDPAGYRSHWSGAYLRTRFTDTHVKIKLGAKAVPSP